MPYCIKCGAQLDDKALFCPNCGTPIYSEAKPSTDATSRINDFILKKKSLSMSEHYELEDRAGKKLGEAERYLFPMVPAKFVVNDASGSEVMYLEEEAPSLRNQFTFYDTAGVELGTIQKKLAKFFGAEEFWVEKNGVEFMRIYGNSSMHDYNFYHSYMEYKRRIRGVLVASVHEKRISKYQMFGLLQDLGSTILEVSIMGDVDYRVVIGAVMVIEHLKVTEGTISHGE